MKKSKILTNKTIGGVIGLETKPIECDMTPWFLESCTEFINGRSALYFVYKMLEPKKIWLPSYCPDFLVELFENDNFGFYEVDKTFKVKNHNWIETIDKDHLIVFISYFGFPIDSECAKYLQEKGAWIVEDACHSLLSTHAGSCSGFTVFSPRKLFGIPDGGLLSTGKYQISNMNKQVTAWFESYLELLEIRKEHDTNKETDYDCIKNHYNALEKEVPVDFITMSDLSKFILLTGVDYQETVKRRITNYAILLEELKDYALIKENDETTVPFGFPITINNRDAIKKLLYQNKIDCDVHWNITKVPKNFTDSYELANEILTIPCDQRYTESDMLYISETLKLLLKGNY